MVFENACRWFLARFVAKAVWNDSRRDVPTNQSTTCVKTWIRGPIRARNQNKRSQSPCHWQVGPGSDPQTKIQGRWAHWRFGGPGRSADLPMGPTAFRFHVEVSHWLLMAVWWGSAAAHPMAPSYKYKVGGRCDTLGVYTVELYWFYESCAWIAWARILF